MAIIRCQACGKPNPDFLDTCQYCDARLKPLTGPLAQPAPGTEPAVIRCQACGKPNPDFVDTCQYCDARLKPLSAAEPPPVPTPIPPAAPEPAREPMDWMSQLRSAPMASAPGETLQAPAPTQAEPEWLWGGSTTGETEGPTPAPHEAQPTSEESPDWLRAMRGAPPAEPKPPSEEVPDWLRSLRREQTARTAPAEPAITPAPEPGLADEQDLPDWLRTIRGTGPLAPTAPEAPLSEPPPEEQPDWLRALRSTGPLEPTTPQAQPAEGAPEEAPEWLRALREAEGTPAETTAPVAPKDKFDWLGGLAYPDEAAPTTPEGAATPTPEEELPEWLRAARGTGALGPPAVGAPSEAPEAWMGMAPARAEPAETAAREEPEIAPSPAEAMPDWLQALRGVAEKGGEAAPDWRSTMGRMAAQPPPSGAEALEEPIASALPPAPGELAEAALPGWLAAMRPVDIERPSEPEADIYEETVGVLAGMRGVLRAELAAALPHKTITRVHQIEASEAHAAYATLLTSMTGEETLVRHVSRHRPRLAALIERWLVFAAVAVAIVVLPNLAPGLFPLPKTIGLEAKLAFDQIESMPATKPALIAFDYEPGQQGELKPAAEAMLGHLMRRGVRVVGISTRVSGAAVGQAVMSEVAGQVGRGYGTDYINLGYIPGGPVGLLQFAAQPRTQFRTDFTQGHTETTTVWDAPPLSQVQSLGDFGLILLVTGTPEAARVWIEQTQAYAASIPMLAAVSAGAEPLVRPYIEGDRPQLDGLVVGLMGAAQYEQKAGWPGDAGGRWSVVGGGLLVAALLMAGGNFVSGVLAWRRRRSP